jgi:hypothetical protein
MLIHHLKMYFTWWPYYYIILHIPYNLFREIFTVQIIWFSCNQQSCKVDLAQNQRDHMQCVTFYQIIIGTWLNDIFLNCGCTEVLTNIFPKDLALYFLQKWWGRGAIRFASIESGCCDHVVTTARSRFEKPNGDLHS